MNLCVIYILFGIYTPNLCPLLLIKYGVVELVYFIAFYAKYNADDCCVNNIDHDDNLHFITVVTVLLSFINLFYTN